MASKRILALLSGGDHRSVGRSDEVVRLVLKDTSLFEDVFAGLLDEDSVVRMRAADAVEKITRTHPSLLTPFRRQILEQVALIEQKEVRWHVAQLLPRLRLRSTDRHSAVEVLMGYLKDKSSIVRTFALQGLSDLAKQDESLRAMVTDVLEEAVVSGTPAMRARARMLLRGAR